MSSRSSFRLKVRQVAAQKMMSLEQLIEVSEVTPNPHENVLVGTVAKFARALQVDISALIESLPE